MTVNIKTAHSISNKISVATFKHMGESVWDGIIPRTVIGIWDSSVIDGGSALLGWRDISYIGTKHDEEYIITYTRSGSTKDLSDISWGNPSLNSETDISSHKDRYLQIRLVLVAKVYIPVYYSYTTQDTGGPMIEEMLITGVTSETASLFFTDTFELGFTPVSAVLTSESDIPTNSILRWGVTNVDSVNLDDYQWIEENSVEDLNLLAATGEKFKIVIQMSGSTGDVITVHEFAAMFGGEEYDQIHLND